MPERPDGFVAAFPIRRVVAGAPATVVGRTGLRAFFAGAAWPKPGTVGPCEVQGGGLGPIEVYGSVPGTCHISIAVVNERRTEKTVHEVDIEVVEQDTDAADPIAAIDQAEVRAMHRLQLIERPPELARRAELQPISAAALAHCYPNAFYIRFRQGSGIRMRAGTLAVSGEHAYGEPADEELAEVVGYLQEAGGYVALRAASDTEARTEVQRVRNEVSSGLEQRDDNLFFELFVRTEGRSALAALLARLAAIPVVAYLAPAHQPRRTAVPSPGATPLPTPSEVERSLRGVPPPPPPWSPPPSEAERRRSRRQHPMFDDLP